MRPNTGREQAIALTNLDQSLLWAIESINQENNDDTITTI